MKKFLCAFFALLLLCSCADLKSKDVEKEPLSISGFTCNLRTTFNGLNITANARYTLPNTFTLEMTAPETVKGMQINCIDGEYAVQYKGIELTVDGDKMPFNMVCRALQECINNAQGKTPERDEKSESLVYTYTGEGHTCQLFVNAETKAFQKITIDDVDALFFENFTYIYGTN